MFIVCYSTQTDASQAADCESAEYIHADHGTLHDTQQQVASHWHCVQFCAYLQLQSVPEAKCVKLHRYCTLRLSTLL